jgi:S-(hydroxymethyl)glutathione dehydrogenase/alcohol dehydrogenase
VGINVIQGARLAQAAAIIAVDVNASKLEKARAFGATHTIDGARENVVEAVRRLTDRIGVDYSFVVTSSSESLGHAFAATAKGGACTVVGLGAAGLNSIPINPTALVLLEKTVQGTFYGSCQLHRDIPWLLDLALSGQLDLDALVSRTYVLDQINEAIADLVAGRNIRGVIAFA